MLLETTARSVTPRIALGACVGALSLAVACSDDAPADETDAGRAVDSGAGDAGTDGGGPGPGEDGGELVTGVEVSHDREVRGVWFATVHNINWPSRAGLDAATQRRELDALLDAAARAGLNTVYFQVRAEADAFYPSDVEPWSRFLTGTMGVDPGYDPLDYAIRGAHARGLELHAWMNPYRALASSSASLASSCHISRMRPDLVVPYGSFHWIDPGLADGQAHTLAVIRDVLERYDVDGLHFDDYFYPYPEAGVPFPDGGTYDAYRAAGGTFSLGDFRRDNVNRLVEAVHVLVREVRPDVRFGISPFGIYRPGMPPGITGLDAYDAIYADPLAWLEGGWVDYIAPQLYWPTTQRAQAYGVLLDWWADRATDAGKDLYVGNFTNKLGMDAAWTVAELLEQIRLTREARDRRALGNIHFHIGPIHTNRSGLTDALLRDFYGPPAASPPIPGETGRPPTPRFTVHEADVTPEVSGEVRYFAVYRDGSLERLVPGVERPFALAHGEYLVSVIDRRSMESLALPVEVTADTAPPPGASCTHSLGGVYAHQGCSASYQCCDGAWRMGTAVCGPCVCTEETGEVGCTP